MMLRQSLSAVIAAAITLAASALPRAVAQTQPAPASSAPASTDYPDLEDSPLLGPEFRDESHLVRFFPPAGSRLIQRGGIATEIISFVNDNKRWGGNILVTLPTKPTTPKDFLKQSTDELEKSFKGVQVLDTQTTVKVGDSQVPLKSGKFFAGRQTAAFIAEAADPRGGRGTIKEPMIRQSFVVELPIERPMVDARGQVIIGEDNKARFEIYQSKYLVLNLFSPEASQAEAAKTFDAMVARFQVLDVLKIEERRKAAIATGREWLKKFSAEDLKTKLIREPQYFRMKVDNRDVGYVRFTESADVNRDGYTGVLTTLSSRTFPNPDASIVAQSEAFWAYRKDIGKVKFDDELYYSCWATSTSTDFLASDGKRDLTRYNEIGTMALDPTIQTREPVLDKDGKQVLDKENNPVFKTRSAMPTPENTETVISIIRSGDKRLDDSLTNKNFSWVVKPEMPAALPKTLENITWPRMVNLDKPAAYAFVVFNAPAKKLGLRTLTVHAKQEVTIPADRYINNKWEDIPIKVVACKLTDEIDPSTTTLYVDDKGKVLFMKTNDGTTLQPTTELEMTKAWAHRINPPNAGGSVVGPGTPR